MEAVTIPAAEPLTDAPTCFYVSAIRGARKALVAGPFDSHKEALEAVREVKALVESLDWRAAFWAWGTAGWRAPREEAPLGALDERGLWPRKEER
jgi:hypothetical protein